MRHSCIALVEFRSEIGKPSVDETAHVLHHSIGLGQDIDEAVKILTTMIDFGHRYKQLEDSLGAGICLVLPTNIGETK